MKKTRAGFTLIEMAIVFLVVGVLSTISIKMSGNHLKNRAIASEAVGMLGMIETSCRLFSLEKGYSPLHLDDLTDAGLFKPNDIEGSYFSADDIGTIVGDERIPLEETGLGAGCGTVNGLTICKLDTGKYTISGTYQP